ncbi:MAG: 30S ribosomal protein S15 [Gammaproteobacteria bacterium]|jgi:small subunit ribosomal protein S15|nr:30S ribosomal protein S15 [Gammaproteobacteria bacterium]MCH2473227.1 30S ribosomal protein S15 [Gammaproteobacteria bacterium]GIS85786.1 MAG: 30S ribosomal protein S15 [Woeseia sp.]|tara:strand:+ start:274 stop:543 length:270 start_codon:yes stop_codon:yes gene_type:complete
MTLTSEIKKEVIDKHQLSKEDTGSTNVQVALLTKKIDSLSDHFKIHKKDNHSRRGLLMMVNKRRKLLDYLKSKDLSSYKQLISNLGLRK